MARLEIDLSVSGISQSTKGFTNFSESIQKNLTLQKDLSAQLEKVKSSLKSGTGDYTKLRTQQESIRQSVNGLNRELRNQVASANSTNGSLVQMRARLSQLRTVYDNLSGSQRNSATTTKTLVAEINKLNGAISQAEQRTGRFQRNVGNYGSGLSALSPQLSQLASKGGGLLGVAFAARDAYKTVSTFDSGLKNVEKTTGLTQLEIAELGKEFVNLSKSLQTVSSNQLTQYASIAGQLGVKGTRDILAFTEALAKLETATNISGEEGGAEIARTLTLVDGGVQNVKAFGDEIVNLGNNFAATEKEILSNAESISQNVGIYRIGRQDVLAYATATKSVGIEAELVGSTFNRTLAIFEKAIRTGSGLDSILKLIGGTQADLSRRFRIDASGVLLDFIGALNRVHREGGSVNEQLENIGVNAVRDQRVIQSLSANGFDVLTRAMDTAKNSAGALDDEFGTASEKMINQVNRIKVSWENLILSIESGTGVIGNISVAFAGASASIIDGFTDIVTSSSFREFFSRIGQLSSNSTIRAISRATGDVAKAQANAPSNSPRGFSTYSDLADFYKASEKEQKAWLIRQEEIVELQSREFQLNKANIKNRNSLLRNAEILARMRAKLAVPVSVIPPAVDGGGGGGGTGSPKAKGKSQADLIKEANEALSKGQVGALRGIDAELLKIDNKYNSIFDKINKITDATTRGQLLAVANVNKETEKAKVALENWAKTYKKEGFSGTKVTTLTNNIIQSGTVNQLPLLERNQDRFNTRYGTKAVSNLGKDSEKEEQRIARVVERGLRSGFNDIFNSIDDLGSNFFEVFSGVFGKLASTVTNTFGQVISTQLGKLLNDRIGADDFNIPGLGSDASKGIIAGGGLLGGILSSQGQKKANTGLSIAGGALSGAAAGFALGPIGAAVGGVIGAISGIFSSAGAKKQQKIQEEQLAEQRKQTALAERQAALAYSSSIIGQMTNQGIVSNIDRDVFGNLVTTIKGSEIQLVLDRSKDQR